MVLAWPESMASAAPGKHRRISLPMRSRLASVNGELAEEVMSEWHPAECNRTGHQGRFLDFVQAAPCATNCVSACCNCVRAASAATVAPTCGSASLSVKIASAARPGGVNIPKSPRRLTGTGGGALGLLL